MAIESPATYAEWFWSHGLEKDVARSTSYEKTLAPILDNLWSNLPGIDELPPYIASFINSISKPSAPDLDSVLVRFIADVAAGLLQRGLGHEIREFDYAVNAYLKNLRITPEIANTLMLRKKITPELWLARQQAAGYSEEEAIFPYEAMKPYPSLPDLIRYGRYHDIPDNPKEFVWSKYDISPDDWELWNWLSIEKFNLDQILSLYKRKYWTEADTRNELAKLGWSMTNRPYIMQLAYSLPNPMLLLQGHLFQEHSTETIVEDISKADIHPDYTSLYIDGVLTKPSSTDVIKYELRKDPSLSSLSKELSRIGIHPAYHDLYRKLAYDIPPISDIITMAVREAFTPAIAARFGQYEDLPPDLISWAEKKGLAKEWAERYWAAHWSLPSATQGFEMLHRGIITQGDLGLLLRALDIMPFWRDKLIQMSYRCLTRVDVRRMYNVGVLDREGVKRAYQNLGYNAYDAGKMTEFTVKLREEAEQRERDREARAAAAASSTWTVAQTLGFYKNELISRERAIKELQIMGYDKEHITVYLTSVTPKPRD